MATADPIMAFLHNRRRQSALPHVQRQFVCYMCSVSSCVTQRQLVCCVVLTSFECICVCECVSVGFISRQSERFR